MHALHPICSMVLSEGEKNQGIEDNKFLLKKLVVVFSHCAQMLSMASFRTFIGG